MMKKCLFIRDDDVWTLNQRFHFFFENARQRGIPVVYAVIPGRLESGLARFLCRAKEETPHLLDIVQHGWVHRNHSKDTKYEFGPLRSLKDQRRDIQEGQKKMRLAFGKRLTNAFVPPYHGYDLQTLRVLEEEGFQVFSNGAFNGQLKGRFMDLPAQLSFSRYGQGRTDIYQAKEMIGGLLKGIGHYPLVGVVTHHMDFTTSGKRKELALFLDYISALKEKKGWRVKLFSEIITERTP
ncbi:MAG: DUF2334 domain-containing protein [Candidatus Omnitrophica bacterium]|nr:DUF2334 domain-containing protein [Candidatus Omnitrophota bacterium]MDE2221571.1 DUF2334 domain-containing protein [Candidatus Omnitrophota bacterium]